MYYDLTVVQFTKMLQNLSAILEKAEAFAAIKKVDMSVLLNTRLSVDQFNLTRQIQIACDISKLAVARLTAKEAPTHEDNEATLPELQARIQSVIEYLAGFSEADFAETATRSISQARWEGKYLSGHEFAMQWAVPNVYFHVTTAYAILRHLGVDVGKKDYLGEMPFKS